MFNHSHMNPNDNTSYNPADDENQGVMTKMVQAETADSGVAQAEYLNPVVDQGPEPEKEEVNDTDSETATNGINNDMLTEEEIEDVDIDESDDE